MWRKHTYLWNVHEVEVVVTDSVNVLLFVYTPGVTLLISMFDVLYLVCPVSYTHLTLPTILLV